MSANPLGEFGIGGEQPSSMDEDVVLVKIDELERMVGGEEGLRGEAAGDFLQAVSASLDHVLANRHPTEEGYSVKIPRDAPLLTLGVVSEQTLVDSTSASTGYSHEEVRRYLRLLDASLRERINGLREPLELEGFGRLTRRGETVTYSPAAFEGFPV